MKLNTKSTKMNRLFLGMAIAYFTLLIYMLITRGLILSIITGHSNPQRLPRAYNLIPFHSLANLNFFNQAFTGNIVMFIPVGILLSCLIIKDKLKIIAPFLSATAFSIVAEILQFALATGSFDINDIIANAAGGAIGVVVYTLIFFIAKGNCMHTKNAITLMAYAFPPFLISYVRMQTVSMEKLHFDFPDAVILLIYFVPFGLFMRKHFKKYFIAYTLFVVVFAVFFYAIFVKHV